jgi:ribA/ribD-fused uncharacterized protein
MSADVIRFYRAGETPYGAFSNLFRRPLRFQGREFPTAEHAYQYGKARKPAVRDWLMAAPSPSLLAMASHGLYSWDVAPGWSRIKLARMRCVLGCKFWQHDDLRDLLIATGSARLVESATVDSDTNRFWGEVDGKGKNMLGVLLMGVREDFRCGIYTSESMHGLEEGVEPDGSRSPWYCGGVSPNHDREAANG